MGPKLGEGTFQDLPSDPQHYFGLEPMTTQEAGTRCLQGVEVRMGEGCKGSWESRRARSHGQARSLRVL